MKEDIQTIVWIGEAATFITTAAIAWFVWRISKRASREKKRRSEAKKTGG
jgi:hypothetical protein